VLWPITLRPIAYIIAVPRLVSSSDLKGQYQDLDVPPVVPHMIHTKGTYMAVLRGFCEKIVSATALANMAVLWRPSLLLDLQAVYAYRLGSLTIRQMRVCAR
jgi:hypothetical protein